MLKNENDLVFLFNPWFQRGICQGKFLPGLPIHDAAGIAGIIAQQPVNGEITKIFKINITIDRRKICASTVAG